MSRGIGEFGPIQDLLPEWMAVVLGLVTQLGDVWFLSVVVAVVYWFHSSRRESVAIVGAMTLAGFALIDTLKRIFTLPRPDRPLVEPETLPHLLEPLYAATGTAGGYGFPSGHAFMTTIVYLSLVGVVSIGTRRHRLAGAIGLIAVVCFSRVALGVHYLVDVGAGIAFGLVFLGFAWTLIEAETIDRGTTAFGIAVVATISNLLPGNLDPGAVTLVGASLGAFGAWQLVVCGNQISSVDRPSEALEPILVRGGLAITAFAPIGFVLEDFEYLTVYSRGALTGLVIAVIVVLPILRHSERAQRVWTALVFWATMAALGGRYLLRPSTWRRIYAVSRRLAHKGWDWVRTQLVTRS